jgi:hypothetical protein
MQAIPFAYNHRKNTMIETTYSIISPIALSGETLEDIEIHFVYDCGESETRETPATPESVNIQDVLFQNQSIMHILTQEEIEFLEDQTLEGYTPEDNRDNCEE